MIRTWGDFGATEVPCFNEKHVVGIGFVHFVQRKEKYGGTTNDFFKFSFPPARSIGHTGQEQADGAYKAGKVSAGEGWDAI